MLKAYHCTYTKCRRPMASAQHPRIRALIQEARPAPSRWSVESYLLDNTFVQNAFWTSIDTPYRTKTPNILIRAPLRPGDRFVILQVPHRCYASFIGIARRYYRTFVIQYKCEGILGARVETMVLHRDDVMDPGPDSRLTRIMEFIWRMMDKLHLWCMFHADRIHFYNQTTHCDSCIMRIRSSIDRSFDSAPSCGHLQISNVYHMLSPFLHLTLQPRFMCIILYQPTNSSRLCNPSGNVICMFWMLQYICSTMVSCI